jgi:hypothetical protein
MWRKSFITFAALGIVAGFAGPAAALERESQAAPSYVMGQLGELRLEVGDDLRGAVPGENTFTGTLRHLRLAPAGDAGRLLYFTPSITLGSAAVSFGAGYGTHGVFPAGETTTMRFGGGVEIGSLRLGAGYEQASGDFLADTGTRERGFDLGAAYDLGPFTTGLSWSRGIYRDFVSTSAGTATQDELSLSLSYRLSHGVDLIGALQYDQSDSRSGPENAGSGSFIFGTSIRF